MFVNRWSDERSLSSSVDGAGGDNIESKRNLLTKLYHAAYCPLEGYTLETHCQADPLCCASKRLFEHMSCCTSQQNNCGVPCCKSCRRVWRHYRKCRHWRACPLCSVLPAPYSSDGLAPRFLKLSSDASVTSVTSQQTGASISPAQSPPTATTSSPTNNGDAYSLVTNSFPSTAAVAVTPPPAQKKTRAMAEGKENNTAAMEDASTSWIQQLPWDSPLRNEQPPQSGNKTPTKRVVVAAETTPTHKIHAPIARRADHSRTSNTHNMMMKPPLSPRRPKWTVF